VQIPLLLELQHVFAAQSSRSNSRKKSLRERNQCSNTECYDQGEAFGEANCFPSLLSLWKWSTYPNIQLETHTGNVMMRDDGRVVGQAQLTDLFAGEERELDCGNDPDVSFTREDRFFSLLFRSCRIL
jgi:hypothetical protein